MKCDRRRYHVTHQKDFTRSIRHRCCLCRYQSSVMISLYKRIVGNMIAENITLKVQILSIHFTSDRSDGECN